MSGNAETIRDFLASLGFNITSAGADEFETVLKNITANALKVGAVVGGSAPGVNGFAARIVNGLGNVYQASRHTGASIPGITALSHIASQAAARAGTAMSLLEGIDGTPGGEGVSKMRNVSRKERDTAVIFSGTALKLNSMPNLRARQYVQMFGFDRNALMAIRRGVNGFIADYQSMPHKKEGNADKASVRPVTFMAAARALTSRSGNIKANLAGGLAGTLGVLRKQLPKRSSTDVIAVKTSGGIWGRVIHGVRLAGLAVGGVTERFKTYSLETKQIMMLPGGLQGASRPSSISRVFTGTFTPFYDKHKAWNPGAKGPIDWGRWRSRADAVLRGIGELRGATKSVNTVLVKRLNIGLKIISLKNDIANLTGQFGEFGSIVVTSGGLINALRDSYWGEETASGPRSIRNSPSNIDFRGQTTASLKHVGGRFARMLKTLGVSPDAAFNLKNPAAMSALMNGMVHHENRRNPYPSEWNQMATRGHLSPNIQQQTTINIHGVSNPLRAGDAVVEKQTSVNSRLTQYMMGKPG